MLTANEPGAGATPASNPHTPNLTALFDVVRLLARQAAREAIAARCDIPAS